MRGYGAYGRLTNSVVDSNLLLWVHEGGIFAVAHVRGGGELGDQWYKAGRKTTKPNTWKDLIACAEYLIAENYTRSQKIAINSLSAGGILIGRAMTERPDLFAAAIPQVGLLNPLRLEKLKVSHYQVNEFGNVKDFTECMALIASDKPILFWANPEAGHLGNTKKQQFETLADVLSFALWQTGHPKYQKK